MIGFYVVSLRYKKSISDVGRCNSLDKTACDEYNEIHLLTESSRTGDTFVSKNTVWKEIK